MAFHFKQHASLYDDFSVLFALNIQHVNDVCLSTTFDRDNQNKSEILHQLINRS